MNLKKIMIRTLLLFFLFAGASCKEKESDSQFIEQKAGSETTISYEDIVTMANQHNEYLNDIFVNFNFKCEDYYKELEANILNTNFGGASMEQKEYLCTFFRDKNYVLESMEDVVIAIENCKNIHDKNLVIEFITAIDTNTFEEAVGYSGISSKIDILQDIAYHNLKDDDLIFVLSYTELLRKSSYYWLPEDLGGDGYGFTVLCGNKYEKKKPSKGVRVAGAAALADAESLAIGMTVTGIVGFFFPPATVGGLVATVGGAAATSAYAAVKEALKKK